MTREFFKAHRTAWLTLSVGVFSFIVLLKIGQRGLWDWDEASYMSDIVRGKRSTLMLGRAGYIFFYHGLWNVAQWAGIRDFHHAFRPILLELNCAFGAVFVSALFWIFNELTRKPWVALAISAATLAQHVFFETATSGQGDIIMFAAIVVSYALFISCHRQRSRWRGFLSALIFGYAFTVREPALFAGAFFPIYLYMVAREQRLPVKIYLAFALTAGLVMLAPSLWFLYSDGQKYIEDFRFTNSHANFVPGPPFFARVWIALTSQFLHPAWMAFVLAAGAFATHVWPQHLGMSRRTTAAVAVLGILPCIFVVWIASPDVLTWSRYFVSAVPVWAMYLVGFAEWTAHLVRLKSMRPVIFVSLIAGCVYADFQTGIVQRSAREDIAGRNEQIYLNLHEVARSKTMWLVGYEAAYVKYRLACDGLFDSWAEFPDWGWPGANLRAKIEEAQRAGAKVMYGRSLNWNKQEQQDVEAMAEWFDFKEVSPGVFFLEPRGEWLRQKF